MTTSIAALNRPKRWDSPFDPGMTEDDVEELLKRPEFAAINVTRFPAHLPLAGILRNDTRITRFHAGELVTREGDYGNSAFLVLEGGARLVQSTDASLPLELLGRRDEKKKNLFQALGQLWTNSKLPEVRDTRRYIERGTDAGAGQPTDTAIAVSREGDAAHIKLANLPDIIARYNATLLKPSELFGLVAAIGRVRRTETVFAETDLTLLEIRWQGLRDIRKHNDTWRRYMDDRYRADALEGQLRACALLKDLPAETLQRIAERTRFETYGSFDWHISLKREGGTLTRDVSEELFIAREGDHPDGLTVIGTGFARVSERMGNGRRTLTYLRAGDHFGLEEIHAARQDAKAVPLRASLSALGYCHVLRIPVDVLEELFQPGVTAPLRHVAETRRTMSQDALLEWAVEEHFINGTQTMLIDLDRCVRCDDCVRACANGHGGNPRFVRHGKRFDHWMVANACMHCADPVCMIGCPTGAIHRIVETGTVVINDDTCIGCGTCANSCPYDNIRLVEIRDLRGRPVLDADTQRPMLKATKCDLCSEQLGGPACVRACPHDALKRVDFHTAS